MMAEVLIGLGILVGGFAVGWLGTRYITRRKRPRTTRRREQEKLERERRHDLLELGARRQALDAIDASRDRIDFLLNVYRWNGLPIPPDDQLPDHIRHAKADHEALKERIARRMTESGIAWPPGR